jgi:hypothetical protein
VDLSAATFFIGTQLVERVVHACVILGRDGRGVSSSALIVCALSALAASAEVIGMGSASVGSLLLGQRREEQVFGTALID